MNSSIHRGPAKTGFFFNQWFVPAPSIRPSYILQLLLLLEGEKFSCTWTTPSTGTSCKNISSPPKRISMSISPLPHLSIFTWSNGSPPTRLMPETLTFGSTGSAFAICCVHKAPLCFAVYSGWPLALRFDMPRRRISSRGMRPFA